jgi:transposase-like protein
MSDPMQGALVVCRSAVPPEPIHPRARLGYQCKACGKPLQVTLTGVAQIERGGTPLCNACGGELVRLMENRNREATLVLNPAAMEYLKRKGEDPEQWEFPPAPEGHTETIACPLCGKEHTARQGQQIDCGCGMSFKLAKAAGV